MGEFRKLNKRLPRKQGQTPEERAREIEDAIDWIRSKEENLADDETDPSLSKVSTGVVAKRSPEQRAHDVSNALNWLCRKGKSNANKHDPTGEFKKLDSLIPSKSGQSPMERARELEGALDWCRNDNVSPCDDDFSHNFNKIGAVKTGPEILKEVLTGSVSKVKEISRKRPFHNLIKFPLLGSQRERSPEERVKDLSNAINWLKEGRNI